jgi:hypothetical protein
MDDEFTEENGTEKNKKKLREVSKVLRGHTSTTFRRSGVLAIPGMLIT